MNGAARHSKNKTIPTIRLVTCPACNRDRLNKYVDEEGNPLPVNLETVEVRGETRNLESCQFCVAKYKRSDEQFVMQNMRKLAKAFKETTPVDDDSDHKDFSLN